ncbi:MAG: hypothetical protein AAF269_06920 [Pseudomonadota bacterium]
MKPMISSLSALAAMIVLTAPAASALTCAEQASDLQNRQIKAQEIADARLALVDEVEAAGDAWENAEAMRNFSQDQAAEADATKVAYDTLKADLRSKEQSLQTLVVSLNKDVAAYNQRCVKD